MRKLLRPQGHVSHAQRQGQDDEREAFFNAPDFVPRMVNVLNIVRSEWFRWFDSGDVADVAWR